MSLPSNVIDKARAFFKDYPSQKSCHIAEDGNAFFGRDTKAALNHQNLRKTKVHMGIRKEQLPAPKEEAAPSTEEVQEAKPTKSNPSKK